MREREREKPFVSASLRYNKMSLNQMSSTLPATKKLVIFLASHSLTFHKSTVIISVTHTVCLFGFRQHRFVILKSTEVNAL